MHEELSHGYIMELFLEEESSLEASHYLPIQPRCSEHLENVKPLKYNNQICL